MTCAGSKILWVEPRMIRQGGNSGPANATLQEPGRRIDRRGKLLKKAVVSIHLEAD